MPVKGFDKARSAIQGSAAKVASKAAIDISQKVVLRTPIDTGRARANWLPSIGVPIGDVTPNTDKSGQQTISNAVRAYADAPSFGVLYLSNNLPYIEVLENGSSTQAPNGMVKQSIKEVSDLFK